MLDVELRSATEADVGFIWATFRDSYRAEQPDMTNADYEAWARTHQPYVGDVVVAHVAGEPGLLVGWLAVHGPLGLTPPPPPYPLLYAYVRKERRREGIMRKLAAAAGIDLDGTVVEHLTRDGRRIKATRPGIRYVPR